MLLDTHVVLWALDDDRRLGPQTRRQLLAGGQVYFSAASVWELVIKQMLGKVALPEELLGDLDDAGFTELPLTAVHSMAMRELSTLARHDPFDRLLVAQARTEGMPLATVDRTLLAAGLDVVRDARV